ncbi:MAG: tRNA (guanosine(37)-N1)-methyltransferase TrmD [Parasporobacterium sp.]|nr:tRNA (guanosine(37)-N1)-methyltransferase TrmD [Parasporobacterium sp.]
MNFHILTLFPDMIGQGLSASILGRAANAGLIRIHTVNFREYTNEKHGHVDDTPFGGGAGMVLKCQPIYDAYLDVCRQISSRTGSGEQKKPRVLYTSPAGRRFNQEMARELAEEEDLIILCGHYEGVDQRVLELMEAEEVSIGDYVLTGGELPAMVMVDAVSRMVPGVLSNALSGEEESFSTFQPEQEFTRKVRKEVYGDLLRTAQGRSLKLLEYPQYTRPEEFMGLKVPEILLSGDHARIDAWRRKQSVERTRIRRPDLLEEN